MGLKELEKRLLEELENIDNRLFLIDMIDRWNDEDKLIHDKLMIRKREIEQEIKQLEIGIITSIK